MISVFGFSLPSAFLAFWSAHLVALLGKRLSRFAVLWWLSQQPSAAVSIAAAVWFALLPTIILGPFVGVLVDRFSRKRAMIVAEGAQAVAVGLILVGILLADTLPLAPIFLFLLISELAVVILDTAFNATMPLMLAGHTLLRVQGLSQTFYHGIELLAAPLGFLLLSHFGFGGALGAHLILSFLALVTLSQLNIPSPETAAERLSREAFRRTFASGVAALRHYRSVLVLVLLLGGANFFSVPASSLKVLLVSEHFGGGALQFSQAEVSAGAGVLLGGIVLAIWGGLRSHSLTFLGALASVGTFVLITGLLPPSAFFPALVMLFMIGFFIPFILASFLTHLQLTVPLELQGRVFTLAGMIALLPVALGLPLSGYLAESFGVIFIYRLAGLSLLVLAGLGWAYSWWRAPRM